MKTVIPTPSCLDEGTRIELPHFGCSATLHRTSKGYYFGLWVGDGVRLPLSLVRIFPLSIEKGRWSCLGCWEKHRTEIEPHELVDMILSQQ